MAQESGNNGTKTAAVLDSGSKAASSGSEPASQPAAQEARAPASGSAAVKPAPRPKKKFGISLYRAWCKRCGICAEFCPTHALVNDEYTNPVVLDEDKCVGCMQCMHRCPDFCVEVYERAEPGAAPGAQTPAKGADAQRAEK
jgi:2-oxoglutarate ferredoxin oxidoreductase subunit delta